MFEVRGKHNEARIFTNNCDNATISQIQSLCNQEIYKDSKIRIMPDCHAGKGCTVGTTMTITDAVTPNLVGIDIGCGMLAIKLREKRVNLSDFDSVIRKYIPSGGDVHKSPKTYDSDVESLRCYGKPGSKIRKELAYCSLGSLGGGNHFIELDKDDAGDVWLVIHSGSRHLGIEVCDYYQKMAFEQLKFEANQGNYETKSNELIAKLRESGRSRDICSELEKFKKSYSEVAPSVPYELAYCTGQLMDDYLHDMIIVQRHARVNRETIAKIILKQAKLHEVERFDTIHNYIDTANMILRKGAISAQLGEKVLIPLNMADGSLICAGKGNPDWNYSAPHGAGRLFSRSETKNRFSVKEYKAVMESRGIYTKSVNQGTLDECPMAYKPISDIIDNIGETVGIISHIRPIYNFKSSKSED